jgi:arsenate reductase
MGASDILKYYQILLSQSELMSAAHQETLNALSIDVVNARKKNKLAEIAFICTHNSRRSQIAEIWFKLFLYSKKIPIIQVHSAGTEATALNHRVANAFNDLGISLETSELHDNPKFKLSGFEALNDNLFYSKTIDDIQEQYGSLFAVMVCSDADENCPYIPGVTRYSLPFIDPKYADDTPQEEAAYGASVSEIGICMAYLCSLL